MSATATSAILTISGKVNFDPCVGVHKLSGTMKVGQHVLHEDSASPMPGCSATRRLKPQGTKLVGSFGGGVVEISR